MSEPKVALDRETQQTQQTEQSEEQENEFECNICLDNVSNPVVTICGHLYCWECLDQWLVSKNVQQQACPVCKAALELDKIIPIYSKGNKVDPRLKRKHPPPPNYQHFNQIHIGIFPFPFGVHMQIGQADGFVSRIFLMVATLVLITIILY
jgi:E3 ubiquitin-protein ligase RNF5